MMISLILPCAGRGSRFNKNAGKHFDYEFSRKKQFIKINGVPLFLHTLKVFEEDLRIKRIYLVLQPEDIPKVKDYLSGYYKKSESGFYNKIKFIPGGEERFLSIQNVLKHLSDETWLMIHDAVRPFLSKRDLKNLIERLIKSGNSEEGLLPVTPVTDTIKVVRGNTVSGTLNRDELRAASTPQCFPAKAYRHAWEKFLYHNPQNLNSKSQKSHTSEAAVICPHRRIPTDDAEIFSLAGYVINTYELIDVNPKITSYDDIFYFKNLKMNE